MKKCYLDSNVFIAFKDEKSYFHKQTKKIIKKLIKESFKLYCSSLVLDEFLFQIRRIFKKKEDYSSVFGQITSFALF